MRTLSPSSGTVRTCRALRTSGPTSFKLKVKSLVSDIMILFSDFKEKLLAGYIFHQQSHLSPPDPRTLRIERDKYLAIYQGLMFTMENLSTKMQVSVSRQKDGVSCYH